MINSPHSESTLLQASLYAKVPSQNSEMTLPNNQDFDVKADSFAVCGTESGKQWYRH